MIHGLGFISFSENCNDSLKITSIEINNPWLKSIKIKSMKSVNATVLTLIFQFDLFSDQIFQHKEKDKVTGEIHFQ